MIVLPLVIISHTTIVERRREKIVKFIVAQWKRKYRMNEHATKYNYIGIKRETTICTRIVYAKILPRRYARSTKHENDDRLLEGKTTGRQRTETLSVTITSILPPILQYNNNNE